MASKTEKLVDTVDNMSLFEKQKLIDALLKDGRVNYPFKDKHEKELAEQEAKIKERLTENVKDEFEGIIKSLRHENQRLKDNLEQTGLIYQQHLKNIQQELEIEKEKLVTAMIRKQEQINQQHREEIKKQKHLHQEQLRKNDLIFQQAFNEKENEIEELMKRVKKYSTDSAKNHLEVFDLTKPDLLCVLHRQKIKQVLEVFTQAKEQLKEHFEDNLSVLEPLEKNITVGEIHFSSIQKELETIFKHYENQLIDEWICEQIIDDIGKLQVLVTWTNWKQKETKELLVFNARKITPIFSNSLSLYRYLLNKANNAKSR